MKKELPFDSVKIGYYVFPIKCVRSAPSENHGSTCKDKKEIFINLTGNHAIDSDTLWHEIKHAIIDDKTEALFGAKITADDIEENVIRHLSPIELMVLQENPELTKWLLNH